MFLFICKFEVLYVFNEYMYYLTWLLILCDLIDRTAETIAKYIHTIDIYDGKSDKYQRHL